MHIIHVATELTPVAKVGGLADVVYGLSKELIRLGHMVDIFLPKYDCLDKAALQNLKIEIPQFEVARPEKSISTTLFSAQADQLNVFLIEPHDDSHFFKRGCIYGCPDDVDRFIYFCQATLQALSLLKKNPDVLHLHDWPTALIAPLTKQKTILTIHNLHYQGKSNQGPLWRAGLSPDLFAPEGELNLLKLGIESASRVATVSPHYKQEIETQESGCGLHGILIKHKIEGILNGIDASFWNPEHDHYLPFHYKTTSIKPSAINAVLEGKQKNKRALCSQLGLNPSDKIPLVAAITRLVPQKSPELIKHALYKTLEKGGQFVLLGSSPIPSLQAEFEALQKQCLEGSQARIIMETEEALAHQIYAASDLFLIPSLFEPCGLTQLIALRYGSIPIARLTGGLIDTVFDIDTASVPPGKRNGFTFEHPNTEGLDWALLRALDCYKNNQKKWKTLMLQGMRYDFSWQRPTLNYLRLYS